MLISRKIKRKFLKVKRLVDFGENRQQKIDQKFLVEFSALVKRLNKIKNKRKK
jgi:hypothetical protein